MPLAAKSLDNAGADRGPFAAQRPLAANSLDFAGVDRDHDSFAAQKPLAANSLDYASVDREFFAEPKPLAANSLDNAGAEDDSSDDDMPPFEDAPVFRGEEIDILQAAEEMIGCFFNGGAKNPKLAWEHIISPTEKGDKRHMLIYYILKKVQDNGYIPLELREEMNKLKFDDWLEKTFQSWEMRSGSNLCKA